MSDWYYEPPDEPDERELNLPCSCSECDYDEYQDCAAQVGRIWTWWEWICPECGHKNEEEIENSKIFDDEY